MLCAATRQAKPSPGGFTLVELLVAVAVFSVLSLMAFSGLQSVLNAQQSIDRHTRELASIQFAVGMLERDLRQAVARSVRDRLGSQLPPFSGTPTSFELSRTAWQNPLQRQRSAIQRVRYGWADQALSRAYWDVLDRGQGTSPITQSVLEGVSDFRMRYRDAAGQWSSQFASRRGDQAWPSAVEFRLEHQTLGALHRIVPLVQDPSGAFDQGDGGA